MYKRIKQLNNFLKKYLLINKIDIFRYTIDDCISILNNETVDNYLNDTFKNIKIIEINDLYFCEEIVIDLIKIYFENNNKVINEIEYEIDENDRSSFSSNFKIYLNDLKKYILLSKDKEREYLEKYILNNDIKSKDIIVYSNQKLVLNYALKKTYDEFLILDLIQEGNLGLLEALEKYDLSYNCRFSTYAYWYIKRNIDTAFNNKELVAKARDIIKLENKIREYCDYIYMTENRSVSMDEICKKFNIKLKTLKNILKDFSTLSLNQCINDEEETELIEFVQEETNFVEELENKYVYDRVIKEMYNILDYETVEMLKMRYQIDNNDKIILDDIAKKFGISESAVSRRLIYSRKKLKNNKKINKLLGQDIEKK